MREEVIRKALEQLYGTQDQLFFGLRQSDANLSSLHPGQAQIFRLWQIYLENVNPLLKITHTPTLQTQIIDAAADITSISPVLEALLFSIYSIAITTLSNEECLSTFGSPPEHLVTTYQFGCQQALLNAGFLRVDNRDCLSALLLYLVREPFLSFRSSAYAT